MGMAFESVDAPYCLAEAKVSGQAFGPCTFFFSPETARSIVWASPLRRCIFSPLAVFVMFAYVRKPRASQRSLAESKRYVDEDLWDSFQERFAKLGLKPRSLRPARPSHDSLTPSRKGPLPCSRLVPHCGCKRSLSFCCKRTRPQNLHQPSLINSLMARGNLF